jgi:hypothetical protein
MKTRSAKNKGKRLQLEVRNFLREKFKNELEDGDIETTIASEGGVDIKLSPLAKKKIPFDVECKNQEKINIWSCIKQAEDNSKDEKRIPMVVFRRNNAKTYCVMEFQKLIELLYPTKNIMILENIPQTNPEDREKLSEK